MIGPELAAARTRLGLTVDQLAERTRIRPHVIEAIEVDDFARCGGDFYARGHLRTLARVLGVDVAPLLATSRSATPRHPSTPRRVFQAELASGGSIRVDPRRPELVGARRRGDGAGAGLVGRPADHGLARRAAARSRPSTARPGPATAAGAAGPTVPVLLRAAGGGAHVVVRDGTGKIVFTGDIAYGQTKALEVSPPVRVATSDGSVEVVVDGIEKRARSATPATRRPARTSSAESHGQAVDSVPVPEPAYSTRHDDTGLPARGDRRPDRRSRW